LAWERLVAATVAVVNRSHGLPIASYVEEFAEHAA